MVRWEDCSKEDAFRRINQQTQHLGLHFFTVPDIIFPAMASDARCQSEKEKMMATCLVVAVGVSLLGLYLKGDDLSHWRRMRRRRKKKKIRVYMDGCFDMMHYGHCNALRQARALGDELVVGVVSDAEIIANKGPPVTPMHERMIMVKAIKWVDEVIPDAPYAITEGFMKKLFEEYNIDYIIHGDDPCVLPDGTDAYALAKKAGRYKQIKRTEGVSSTDIVGIVIHLFVSFTNYMTDLNR